MIVGIDHIVIMVSDLDSATRRWGDLGFTVIPGGRHPRGTHNALVCFLDGSYLELIAFWEPEYDAHRWHRFMASGAGLIDYALGSDDLKVEIEQAGARGVNYVGPSPGARSRPDGVQLAWRTAHPAAEPGHALPFLIDDVTDREFRVPAGDARIHANGVRGVDALQIVVAELERAAALYTTLLDAEPVAPSEDQSLGQRSRVVALRAGDHQIELHQPGGDGPASSRLASFGDGPFAVRFHGSADFAVDPATIDGARIRCRTM